MILSKRVAPFFCYYFSAPHANVTFATNLTSEQELDDRDTEKQVKTLRED